MQWAYILMRKGDSLWVCPALMKSTDRISKNRISKDLYCTLLEHEAGLLTLNMEAVMLYSR